MLNQEIWTKQVMEGFYPDDSFLTPVLNFSELVDNDKIHIASAGIDPKVLINNNTYPIKVTERNDTDCEITLDVFETENTVIRRPEELEYSYDKLESVIRQHRATLSTATATKAAHAFAPLKDTDSTPVLTTTGEVFNGRNRLCLNDILTLKERFDDARIPLEERYIILHPKHVSDLLREDVKLFKDITDIRNGKPFKFAGFGFYSFPYMPHYRNTDGTLQKIDFETEVTETDAFASVAFYAKEVMKADGDIHMYAVENDPRERGAIIGFDKRFIALPIRNMGIGAIVSTIVGSDSLKVGETAQNTKASTTEK